MTEARFVKATNNTAIELSVEATPRDFHDKQHIGCKDLDHERKSAKKFTNTKSKIISSIGLLIVGFIVYKLIVTYAGWL